MLTWSTRTIFISDISEETRQARQKPIIITFWHGHQLMMLFGLKHLFNPFPRRKTFALISEHSDGRIIASVIRYFNLHSIAGSSTRSAKKATIRLLKTLTQGDNIAITPDGPIGPIYEAKIGVIKMAQLSGLPIVPMALHADRSWKMRSWDQMMVPKPFSKVYYSIGEPLYIPRDLPEEELSTKTSEVKNLLDHHLKKVQEAARV